MGGTNAYMISDILTANTIRSDGTTLLSYTPNQTGTFSYAISATDRGASTATFFYSAQNSVTVNPTMSEGIITVSAKTLPQMQTDGITGSFAGGTAPYTYNFTVTNAINGKIVADYATSNSYQSNSVGILMPLTYDDLGAQKVNLLITDGTGEKLTITNTIIVTPGPLNTSISTFPILPDTLSAGQILDVNAFAIGGSGSYTYNFLVYNSITRIPINSVVTSSNSIAYYVPVSQVGNTLAFNVIVTDGSNTVNAIGTASLRVIAAPSPPCGGGICGSGGSGVQNITISLSTVPSTLLTTYRTTTIPENNKITVKVTLHPNSGQNVYFNQSGVLLTIEPNGSNTTLTITLQNITSEANTAIVNYTELVAVNMVTNSAIGSNMTVKYNCSIPSALLQPFILRNGTWEKINSFVIDVSSCSVTFTSGNGAFALMAHNAVMAAPKTSTIIVSTTSATTANSSGLALWLAAIAIIVIGIFAYVIFLRTKSARQ
jgi:hypothetical protein